MGAFFKENLLPMSVGSKFFLFKVNSFGVNIFLFNFTNIKIGAISISIEFYCKKGA